LLNPINDFNKNIKISLYRGGSALPPLHAPHALAD